MKILLISLISTNTFAFSFGRNTDKTPKDLILKCLYVSNETYRCENKEIICYKIAQGSDTHNIACKFKENEK